MAIEIERKFLVCDDSWRTQADSGVFYSQGYLSTDPQRCVRVRIAGQRAWLNIKSAVSTLRRLEYEYEIPLGDARELLHGVCVQPTVEKTRYHVAHQGHVWELDVFAGEKGASGVRAQQQGGCFAASQRGVQGRGNPAARGCRLVAPLGNCRDIECGRRFAVEYPSEQLVTDPGRVFEIPTHGFFDARREVLLRSPAQFARDF